MNKKGFTLVELLAVIVVLGLIITITATKGFGAFDKVKGKIIEEKENQEIDAINIILEDIYNCDDDLEDWKELRTILITAYTSDSITSCEKLKSSLNNYNAKINKNKAVELGYLKEISTETEYYINYDKSINKGVVLKENDVSNEDDLSKRELENYEFYFKATEANMCAQINLKIEMDNPGAIDFYWDTNGFSHHDPATLVIDNQEKYTNSGYYYRDLLRQYISTITIKFTSVAKDDYIRLYNFSIPDDAKLNSISYGAVGCTNKFEEILN